MPQIAHMVCDGIVVRARHMATVTFRAEYLLSDGLDRDEGSQSQCWSSSLLAGRVSGAAVQAAAPMSMMTPVIPKAHP